MPIPAFTQSTLPGIITYGAYGLAAVTGIYTANDIYSNYSGYNIILDKLFDNRVDRYEMAGLGLFLLNGAIQEYVALNSFRLLKGIGQSSDKNGSGKTGRTESNNSSKTNGTEAVSGGNGKASGTGTASEGSSKTSGTGVSTDGSRLSDGTSGSDKASGVGVNSSGGQSQKGVQFGQSSELSIKTQKDIKIPILPEGSQWERNVLNSFKGGKATPVTYEGGITLYRVGGKNGSFWSLDSPPLTEYQWRVDFAIKQEFCNDASTLYKITIPKGSTISGLEGIVGPQGMGLYGGAHQVYIDYREVPSDWIEITPINWK